MASPSPSASESGKDDEEGHPMPPFPIKSPTTGNDLPSMRKELREHEQLAIVRARERTLKRDEETRTDGRAEGRAEDEDDDIGRLTSSLEGLVAVADGNLSVLVTGDKRFATTQFMRSSA